MAGPHPNPRIMYFFAFPLLLVASTIYASPVRIESRGNSIGKQVKKPPEIDTNPEKWVYDQFYGAPIRIQGWSRPVSDTVIQPRYQNDEPHTIIVKKVDLSTVEVSEHVQSLVEHAKSLTDVKSTEAELKLIAQRKEVLIEIENLEIVGHLKGWYTTVEHTRSGESKLCYYIAMKKMGNPVSDKIPQAVRDRLRKNGIEKYSKEKHLRLDPKYDKDEHFAFPDVPEVVKHDSYAVPIFWRYAQRI